MVRTSIALALTLAVCACNGGNGGDDSPGDSDAGGGPDQCEGCIDSSGNCVAGSSVSACGSGGASCSACGANEICPAGECVAPPACGPDNCPGCCAGDGTCQGTTDSACGTGGGACEACPVGSSCSLGACVAESCAAGCDGCCSGATCLGGDSDSACGVDGDACIDCGSARNCEQGLCTVDPATRWDVVAVSGTVPEQDTNNAAWDLFGGLPDPLVSMRATDSPDTVTGDSGIVDNTLLPLWNDVVLSDVPARLLLDTFVMTVFDDDVVDADDQIGTCAVALSDDDFSDTLRQVDCPRNVGSGQAGFTVRFRIRPH
jgi:hypothetical protein